MSITKTEVFRQFLDERGMQHNDMSDTVTVVSHGKGCAVAEEEGGRLTMSLVREVTPAQAILALMEPSLLTREDSNLLKPIPGYTRDEIVRELMLERDEVVGQAVEIMLGMLEAFRMGARSGEGVSRAWSRELYDTYRRRIHDAGFDLPDDGEGMPS